MTNGLYPSDQPFQKMQEQPITKVMTVGWLIFAVGVLYYCFAYLLRVYPSVMELDLRGYFNITASGFGLLTSFYYFSYAPMQLPVGVSVDRIGPRKSLITACIVSTSGVFLFAYFDNFIISLFGRFLIGFGAAFAYVTALKLTSVWLPKKYFATATGIVTGCGMLSAIITDIYLTRIITFSGFKQALYFPLFSGIIMLCLILLIVRDKPKKILNSSTIGAEAHALSYRQLIDYLKHIIKNPQMWLIGIVGALLYLPASVFLDVWAIPYLHYVYHLSSQAAALGVSVMLAGWICSSFVSCILSDLLGARKKPLVISSFIGIFISTILIFSTSMPTPLLYGLLFAFGICCGPHPLCFTLSKENNEHQISGTAISFANFVIMMGGFIFQPIVGKILDWLWEGRIVDGIRVYSSQDYRIALSILPIALIIAAICSLMIKETYQKQHSTIIP